MPRRLVVLLPLLVLACQKEAPPPPAASSAPTHTDRRAGPAEAEGIGYIEHLTAGASATEPLPLIIAMHGRGGRPENLAPITRGLHARARVILPYALTPVDDGFEWFPMSTSLPPAAFAADVAKAADRVAQMITALAKEKPTLGKPIVTGFSQGGFLSFALTVLHPEIISEAIPVSGRLPTELWPTAWPPGKTTPTLHALHGDADPLVPITDDRNLIARLKQLGFPADLHEYPGVPHTITPEMRRDLTAALDAAAAKAAQR